MKHSTVVMSLLLIASLAGAQPEGAASLPLAGPEQVDPGSPVSGSGGAPAAEQNQAAVTRDADLEHGRTIAMGGAGVPNACFTCHGVEGQGEGAGALPRLAGQSAFYLYKQLKDYASGGRKNRVMGPIAEALSDADMRDVAAYYAAQTEAPYSARPEDTDPELLQHGGSLSAVGDTERGIQACINCHGPGGSGTPPLFPYLAGQHASYLELQLVEFKLGRRGNDSLGVMEYIAQRMSAEDMRAAAAYFESVRPENPEAQRDADR